MTDTSINKMRTLMWERLTDEQVQGAHLAIRWLDSSPRFGRSQRELFDDAIDDLEREMLARPKLHGFVPAEQCCRFDPSSAGYCVQHPTGACKHCGKKPEGHAGE